MSISSELETYLKKWHNSTLTSKRKSGHQVDLSYADWLGLFSERQLNTLEKAIASNRLGSLQHKSNDLALVATWQSYAACSSGIYDKSTARICARKTSKAINLPKKGDKLRPSHVAKVAEKLTGVVKTEDHRQNISDGKKGQPIAGWGEDRKAAKSEAMKAYHAKRKAEQEAVRKAAEDAAWARLAERRSR